MSAVEARNEDTLFQDLDQALLALRKSRGVGGYCDICGRWDSQVEAGIGDCCQHMKAVKAHAPQLHFPANEHQYRQLFIATAVLIELDELGVGVERVLTGHSRPVITTCQALPEGVGSKPHASIRSGHRYMTATLGNATIEWRAHA